MSLCVSLSPSVLPKTLLQPAQTPLTPASRHPPHSLRPQPSHAAPPHRPLSLTLGGHAPPAAQRPAPGQQDPAHPRGTTRTMPNFPQKFQATPWGRGQGRAVPSPPPSSGLPGFGNACLPRRAPGRLCSATACLPRSPASYSPSQTSGNPFPAPGSPSASAHRTEPRGHLGLEGLTRGGEDQPCLKGAPGGG